MTNLNLKILIISSFVICSTLMAAPKRPAFQVRTYYANAYIEPEQVNTDLDAKGIEDFSTLNLFGVEFNVQPVEKFRIGLDFSKRLKFTDENDQEDYAKIDQDVVSLVARFSIIDTKFFIFDIFAGYGKGQTNYTTYTGSPEYITSSDGQSTYNTELSKYGSSLAFGYSKYFVYIEGGYENNYLDTIKKEGSFHASLKEIDLSGTYFMVGILFYDKKL